MPGLTLTEQKWKMTLSMKEAITILLVEDSPDDVFFFQIVWVHSFAASRDIFGRRARVAPIPRPRTRGGDNAQRNVKRRPGRQKRTVGRPVHCLCRTEDRDATFASGKSHLTASLGAAAGVEIYPGEIVG